MTWHDVGNTAFDMFLIPLIMSNITGSFLDISGVCECETQQHTLKNNESQLKLLRSAPAANMLGAW